MPASAESYRMLIVEDDLDIASGLILFFESMGYDVAHAGDGERADEILKTDRFDVVLLDVMLPGKNGFDVLRGMLETGNTSPVLMLTGRTEQEDILKSFGLGATDYLTKPFSVDELAARVRAILHRTQPPSRAPMEVHRVGDVDVNFSTHEALRNGRNLDLTALEFDVLKYLIQNRGRLVTRQQLLRDVWGIDQDIVTRTIDRHVASLRKKLEPDSGAPAYIETVYGMGYRFNG